YEIMFRLGRRLMEGLRAAAADFHQDLLIQGPGPMFHLGFTDLQRVADYRDTLRYDKARLGRFISALHDERIRIIGRGLWYISAAHTEADIDHAIEVSRRVFGKI
ncbi:MAG: aspartate aminotransferase family protein, partial [Acidobacteriota bacterium]